MSATSRNVAEEATKQKFADLERKKIKQKESETKALHIIERLLDNPIEEDFLKDACQFLSTSHYQDVTEERGLGDLCGYPLCSVANAKRPNQKYRISTKNNKVYDITERKNFCSDGCYKASRYLEKQIRTTPVWMRDGETRVQFTFLPPRGERGLAGDVVVDHPAAEIASELAGISLADKAPTNRDPDNSAVSTNQERSSKPGDQNETAVSTNRERSTEAEDQNETAVSTNQEPVTKPDDQSQNQHSSSDETRTKSYRIDSDDDSDDENTDHPGKTDYAGSTDPVTDSSDRKLQDLMKLIDRRDKLIKQLRAEANEKSTNSATATKTVPTESKSTNCLPNSPPNNKTGSVTSQKSHEISRKSILTVTNEIGKPTPTKIAALKTTNEFLEPRKKIEKFLSEWITKRTMDYLRGNSDFDRLEAMEKLECKLKEEERMERLSERKELSASDQPTNPVPDYEQLKSQSAEFDVKVRSFYSVGRKKTNDEKAKSDDINERDADWTPVMPLVDSQSQTAIRRRIVTDALRKTLPSILTLLTLSIDDVTPHLKTLIRTFNLTKENIMLKPGEWTLMTVYVLKLFIAYKLPKLHHTTDPVMKDGLRFYYLDANNPVWQVSPTPINKDAQPIAGTIGQVYGNKDIMHLMYNDEKPDGGESESHGHTKGVVAFGATTGFWLVHSVPKFPGNVSYDYPATGQHYGQAFLCMTLGMEGNFDKIVDQLLITYPFLYSDFVPQSLSTAKLRSLIGGGRNRTDQGSLVELKSSAGQSFYSFAKSDAYGKDLYSAWLAPWVKSSVYVESWMNGKNPLPSECGQTYKVKNIRDISFGGEKVFKETQDHSKWAVAETQPWSCVGGINRMETQESRCGGTVCFKNAQVNLSFKGIITKADACPKFVHYAPRPNVIEQL